MSKQSATVKTTFNLLNVKLRMPEAKEATQDDYIGLLMALKTRHIQALITPNIGVIMKRCLIERVGDNVILWGIITRFTPLVTGKLLNLENPDEEEEDQDGLPKNRVPNPKDVIFFFTPANHRLAISKKGGALSIKNAQQYFEKAFKQVLKTSQSIDVDIEQDGDTFQEILDAPKVKRVKVVVTYSNNDMYSENAGKVDETMKSSNMQKLIFEAVADDSPEGLNFDKIPFLQGAFKLAQSNGLATATVVDAKSPTKRGRVVETEEHPREESITSEKPADVPRNMFAKMLDLFSRG
jgi:hypothetical protein